MAATQPNKSKRGSSLPTLQTPQSGTYPSELRSPMIESPSLVKREEGLKTPITPPSAYLDYLKNMSPALMSPGPTGTSNRFSFNDKPSDTASAPPTERTERCSVSPPTSEPALSRLGSYDQPTSLSRNTSYDSTTTQSSEQSAASFSSAAGSSTSTARPRPESPRVTIPPSPFAKPALRSARTPRRLKIPQSPFSPAVGSAQSVPSPFASTPLSAAPWSASFSPREYEQSEAVSKPGKVSVRQTVTRTVTYCRTPLDPAPKGKRRKVEEASDDSKESSTEPLTAVKQEPVDSTSVLKDTSKSAEVIKPAEATSTSSSTTPAPPANASKDSGTK